MKQGKLIRCAVSAALAGCMMFTLSAPALAESTDALMQLSISGNRAVSVLDAENGAEDIKINNKVIDPADYDNIVINNKYTFHYDPVQKVLTSTSTITINAITIEVPDDVDVVLDGGTNSAVNVLTINGAHDVTISSDTVSAIGNKASINCTGKVTVNAPGANYAIGYSSSTTDGILTISRASEVEINAPSSSRVMGGWYSKADITCDGPVTIRGNADGGSTLAKSFTYAGDYVYFTSEDEEEGAIDAGVTPIEANARYSYLHIEKKTVSAITVKDGIAKAGESEVSTAFNGQKVTVTFTVQETDERKFDGWEVTKAPAGFKISAEKLAQREFSFIMPKGEVILTARWSGTPATEPADPSAAAPADGGAGGAIAAVAIGGAALWGGYEAATRVILHNLLPEGAAIPKTQAQLALLLWNTAGQPEPANEPAFADVDAATAKAAQWCTEQGYLSGTFKPAKRVAKYNVIRTWNKAFPKH